MTAHIPLYPASYTNQSYFYQVIFQAYPCKAEVAPWFCHHEPPGDRRETRDDRREGRETREGRDRDRERGRGTWEVPFLGLKI